MLRSILKKIWKNLRKFIIWLSLKIYILLLLITIKNIQLRVSKNLKIFTYKFIDLINNILNKSKNFRCNKCQKMNRDLYELD